MAEASMQQTLFSSVRADWLRDAVSVRRRVGL